ncbi:hypothetical protein GCM10010430_48960 [Kitasatospora cystarginea]|uniref:DUF2637 domain-containing protein n=1 Tax=Kitasatospora cystarginea TaxID=58350 RepID=A0ABP5RDX3_9ACTN
MSTTAHQSTPKPTRSHVTGWDHAAIGLLALAGFALSYDALRQTAQAIHVRGPLTYVYPLIIDGFIAYSVRALLILRTAPLGARAYVWILFLSSTTASVWANVLHAVLLNEQALATINRLHLGDTAVGILSMIAPLALAGAVHLGIITTRHTTSAPTMATSTGTATADRSSTVEAASVGDLRHAAVSPADRHTEPQSEPAPLDDVDRTERSAADDTSSADRVSVAPRKRTGRPPAATMDQLLAIARPAVAEHGISVAVVQNALRDAKVPIGSERFTKLMNRLRDEQVAPLPERARVRPAVD